jgi:DNA-binding response OmpR family regulator
LNSLSLEYNVKTNLKEVIKEYLGIKMGIATILIIEGKRAGYPAFSSALIKKGYEVMSVASGSDAIKHLNIDIDPDVIIVSAASLRSTGKRICQSLRDVTQEIPIILIIAEGGKIENGEANITLNLPFTVKKLENRLKHVLPHESEKTLRIGPIRLDIEQRIVRCLGKQTRLTPRLISLLSLLIKQHGEILERNDLFSRVWETDYTDDTRTLDVHISWLRKAIEVDPLKPRFL